MTAATLLLTFTSLLGAAEGPARAEPGRTTVDQAGDRNGGKNNQPAGGELRNKLLLLFDSSGSMAEPDASGISKMDAARKAFHALIPKLPDNAEVGLRVYGATVFSKNDPGACQDTQNLVPVTPLDRTALSAAVENFRPYGETPISASLRAAAQDLGTSGKRTILLVSDGEETCDPNPCETAKEISGLGIDLKIDVVGFKVAGKARQQLRCITDAGNGTFYNADDADDLVAGMERLAVRAFRPFRVDGKEVKGGTEENPGDVLRAGKYVDTAPAIDQTKYYRLRRGIPGSTLHVGATARPAPGDQVNTLKLETLTLDGKGCGYGLGTEVSYANTNPVVTAAVSSWSDLTTDEPGCTSDEMLLGVRQDGSRGGVSTDNLRGVPIEFVVIEEPPVSDPEAALKVLAENRPDWVNMDDKGAEEIVPGASFSDAPEIGPGTYTTSLFPGEVGFVRVGLGWGQRLQAEVRVPEPDAKLADLIDYPQPLDVRLIAPTRGTAHAAGIAEVRDQAFLEKESASTVQTGSLDIIYGNRTGISRKHQNTSLSGYYYVAFSLGRDEDGQSYTVPIEVTVGVAGSSGTDGPGYAGGGDLAGPGVEDVTISDPAETGADPGDGTGDGTGDDPAATEVEGARPDPDAELSGQADTEVALPEEGMSSERLALVLALSGVVVALIAVSVTREVLRRRRTSGR